MAAVATPPVPAEQAAYSIPDTCETLGLSRQTIYDEINAGRLRSFTVGRRRLVSRRAIEDWIAAREAESSSAA